MTTAKLKLTTFLSTRLPHVRAARVMERECPGCQWISGEIDRRNRLIHQFRRVGDYRLAQIAQEGIGALLRDWRAHAQRDHGTDAVPS